MTLIALTLSEGVWRELEVQGRLSSIRRVLLLGVSESQTKQSGWLKGLVDLQLQFIAVIEWNSGEVPGKGTARTESSQAGDVLSSRSSWLA